MNIPRKIKIQGLEYDVEFCDLPDDWGTHSKGSLKIQLSTNITGEYKNVCLWHEILHAVNTEIEEKDIVMLSHAIYQVIKDNPELFK